MNSVRDFWETVVLRDVLGYMVPGAVTLLALALLLLPFLVLPLAGKAPHFVISGVLRRLLVSHKPWVCSYPWLVAAIVIPVCFVIGHVQGELVAFLGNHCVPCWNLGFLALDFLTEDAKRGGDYADAALRELAGIVGAGDLVAVCAEQPGRFRELCCCLSQVGSNTEKDDCVQKAKGQAKDLWYLCNHYVLYKSPRLHTMWIGRYYVLAILFSNLLLSFSLLAVSLLMLLLCLGWHLIHVSAHLRWVASQPITVLRIVGLLVAVIVGIVWMCALGVCSWRFHKAYVERTFPIFYVLSRPRGHACRDQGRQTPDGGAPPRRP